MSVVADFTFTERFGDLSATVSFDDAFIADSEEQRQRLSSDWFDQLELLLKTKTT